MLSTHLPSDPGAACRYQAQLHDGFHWLRFVPGIEREFQAQYLRGVRWRVVACLIMLTFATAWIAATNERASVVKVPDPGGMGAGIDMLRTWVLRPISVLLVITAVYRPLFMRIWLTLVPLVLMVSSAVGTYSAAGHIAAGNLHAFSAMLVGSLGAFLLLGMLFWQIVIVGSSICFALYMSLAAHGAPEGVLQFEMTVILMMFSLVAVFFYNLEYNMRASFLQRNALRELGHRDVLTGLYNRRAFDQHLESLWRQARRDRQTLGLIMCDVDDFKAYNDRYGHPAGDTALLQVGQVLAAAERRPLDVACRVGGEEFALLFYATSESHVRDTCERMLAGVRALDIRHEASRVSDVMTISLGATMIRPTVARTAADLVQCADEALYTAKENGRNCYAWQVLADDSVVSAFGRRA